MADPGNRPNETVSPGTCIRAAGPESILGIYKLEGDTLTYCYTHTFDETDRPADFKPQEGVVVAVFKRQKP